MILILVVVDDGLVRIVMFGVDGRINAVLILVVVDNGLVPCEGKDHS